jgi:hypothetical protein
MKTKAYGKEQVIDYLEKEASRRSGGKDVMWMIGQDDSGKMVAFIAGFGFLGEGTIRPKELFSELGIEKATFANGVLLKPNNTEM